MDQLRMEVESLEKVMKASAKEKLKFEKLVAEVCGLGPRRLCCCIVVGGSRIQRVRFGCKKSSLSFGHCMRDMGC